MRNAAGVDTLNKCFSYENASALMATFDNSVSCLTSATGRNSQQMKSVVTQYSNGPLMCNFECKLNAVNIDFTF